MFIVIGLYTVKLIQDRMIKLSHVNASHSLCAKIVFFFYCAFLNLVFHEMHLCQM